MASLVSFLAGFLLGRAGVLGYVLWAGLLLLVLCLLLWAVIYAAGALLWGACLLVGHVCSLFEPVVEFIKRITPPWLARVLWGQSVAGVLLWGLCLLFKPLAAFINRITPSSLARVLWGAGKENDKIDRPVAS
ncbi:hypothetical protein [Xylella fastidiosa]|uniref:hypothetical protein n=1 Tax=Xylella fastidiosa TaxID=2371 RepID=UPI0005836F9F|nr:hypothetical protein [Xylella fastidiosa]AVI20684.1 hypothetical protein BCV75_05275 [Xylella fastidiosa]KIA58020.1 hypothetical protein RA12_05555 [Xylella fastidiosa]KXB19711.1 hypothetical protein ADT31_00885 [Xylella fastidiosa]TNW25413.1 hypothetical protein EIP74_02725 [Xylella fastidiosa subsp. pauca]